MNLAVVPCECGFFFFAKSVNCFRNFLFSSFTLQNSCATVPSAAPFSEQLTVNVTHL